MIVSQVNVYPIKSCAGTSLQAAAIDARGFAHDRRWLVVDPAWSFLTQRDLARMALIQPALADGCLHLSAPGMGGFALPVDQTGRRVEVTIWHDSGIGAVDQGDAAADWLSAYLKQAVRLVRFADDAVRPVDPRYAPRPTDQTGFSDGYPFLILSEESLADLNSRLDDPLPMNRFRPNLVVRGAEAAFAEDTWKAIRIGDLIFDLVKPCARCAITTTDQATGQRGKEPLRTLATYRQGPKGSPLFGQNAIHRSTGIIHQGDAVEIVEYRHT